MNELLDLDDAVTLFILIITHRQEEWKSESKLRIKSNRGYEYCRRFSRKWGEKPITRILFTGWKSPGRSSSIRLPFFLPPRRRLPRMQRKLQRNEFIFLFTPGITLPQFNHPFE